MHSSRRPQLRKVIYTAVFLLLTLLILTDSQKSMYYASNGLNLWFTKMIPSLLPFMILSGIMVRLHLTEGFASVIHPLLYPAWKVRKNVTYAMIMGFLCGFPMGARVTCDLLAHKKITEKEAQFLLAFCNNIGPVYFISFVLPLLHKRPKIPYLFGMYGLPFLYGLFLRHTVYRKLSSNAQKSPKVPRHCSHSRQGNDPCFTQKELRAASYQEVPKTSLLETLDDAITTAIQSILSLGGYMILFNLLNLIPDTLTDLLPLQTAGEPAAFFIRMFPSLTAPILEITGGLSMLGDRMPLYSLLLLPFGGLSCMAQTYSIIRHSNLSIHIYVYHKLVLTGITVLYYVLWNCLAPASFLL